MRIALFIVALLVITALVAAAGDRMGHLAARRKIRFGNMRPRNVSTLIAVITGLLISAATFALLFTLWVDFRDALLRYDSLKADLAKTQQQLASQQDALNSARRSASQAQEQARLALEEKDVLEADLSKMRGEKVELAIVLAETQDDLAEANQLVARREGEIVELTSRRDELQEEVASLESIAFGIMPEYIKLIREIKEFKEGEIVYPRGTYLYYQTIAPAAVDTLESELAHALDELGAMLSQQGLSLHAEAPARAASFAATYPFRTSEQGAVVVFSTARNVVSGGEVEIELSARPLEPLIEAGEELLTVLVEDDQAAVSWRDQKPTEFAVPASFDEQSLEKFTWQLFLAFTRGGRESGFLPDLETGEIPNPVESLIQYFDELAGHERPFTIQFVAKSDANALEGLADCNIYISKWPPGPPQEQ